MEGSYFHDKLPGVVDREAGFVWKHHYQISYETRQVTIPSGPGRLTLSGWGAEKSPLSVLLVSFI